MGRLGDEGMEHGDLAEVAAGNKDVVVTVVVVLDCCGRDDG